MRAQVLTVRNPFDPLGSRQAATLRRPARIRGLMPAGVPAIAVLNGRPVLRAGWRRRLRDGDQLVVMVLPRGGGGGGGGSNPLRTILSLALMAFAPWAAGALLGASAGTVLFGTFTLGQATALGIYMAGSALINAALPAPGSKKQPVPSPTYTLQAQGNSARLDQPIPVQYGRMLSYPDFAAQPYAEYSGNEQFLYQLLCLGAGEYDIEELRIEDTPLSAFSEIETQIVPPGGNVTLFPTSVITSVEVSGQELVGRKSATWSRTATTVTITETGHLRAVGQVLHLEFTTGGGPDGVYAIATIIGVNSYTVEVATGSGSGDVLIRAVQGGLTGFVASGPETVAHRLGIDLIMPRGIYETEGGGGLGTISISVRFEAQLVDEFGEPDGSWIELGEETITDRTNTPQRISYIYPLDTPGRYAVRAWRLDQKLTATNTGHEVLLGGLRAYLAEPADFGPVTLIALRMRASNNLSAQASRKIAVLSTRKLPVWNGTTWTAPQVTRSIAWALADAARDADYGARLPESRLDLPALLALDAIWAARGDTFNARFDAGSTWWDSASKIALAGRAKIFMQGGKLRVSRDGAASLPVQLFTERNIVAGSLGVDFAMPGQDTADAVDVAIFDGTLWQPRRIKARLPGSTAERPATIDLLGCTSADQAMREGLYHAASNRYRRETVKFETEMEGFIASIGDLIAVQHSMPGWGQQAEAVAWDPATLRLTVTEPLDWSGTGAGAGAFAPFATEAATWTGDTVGWSGEAATWEAAAPTPGLSAGGHLVGLRARDGSAMAPIAVTRGGADNVLVLAEAPPEAPFTGTDAERTHIAFGGAETWRAPCKVVSVTPRGLHRVLIEAVVDDPSVHTADAGAVAPPVRYSALPRRVVLPVVDGLMARLMEDEPDRAVLAWRPAPGADLYQIEMAEGADLADPNVSWTRVAETTASQHFVTVLHPARTMIRVRGIGLAPGPWIAGAFGSLVGLYWLAGGAVFWGADIDDHWRT